MGFYFTITWHRSYQLCQRTGSSDSLRINTRGSALLESWTIAKRQRLSPKCHVSLNESQWWLFLPVMAADNGGHSLSPGAHLHSNNPATSCSLLCFLPFFLYAFFPQTESKLHRRRDRELIIRAVRRSRLLWGADVLFHTSLVACSRTTTSVLRMLLHVLHCTWPVMKCLVVLNSDLRGASLKKKS